MYLVLSDVITSHTGIGFGDIIPDRFPQTEKKIPEYIIDKTMLKVG